MARVDELSFLSFPMPMKSFLTSTTLFLVLAACATRDAPAEDGSLSQMAGQTAGSAMVQTRAGLPDAAMAPLEDLNLRRDEIPPILAAIENPYAVSVDAGCDQIVREITALDKVLGADSDAPKPEARPHAEVLAEEASGAALGVIKSTTRSLIPFRGVVRKATGAESHQKKYDDAFKLGAQRRAYLKGYGLAKGCPDVTPTGSGLVSTPEPIVIPPPDRDATEGPNVIGNVIYSEDIPR
jgi:hypothetical protein